MARNEFTALLAALVVSTGCGTWAKNPEKPGTGSGPPKPQAVVTLGLAAAPELPVRSASGLVIGALVSPGASLQVDSIELVAAGGEAGQTLDGPFEINPVTGAIAPTPKATVAGDGRYAAIKLTVAGGQLAADYTSATGSVQQLTFKLDTPIVMTTPAVDERAVTADEGGELQLVVDLGLARWFDFSDLTRNPTAVDLAWLRANPITLDGAATGTAKAVYEAVTRNMQAGARFGTDANGDGRLETDEAVAGGEATPPPAPATPTAIPDLGVGADLNGRVVLPESSEWNRVVADDPVDPQSDKMIEACGKDASLRPYFGTKKGFPYVVVDASETKVDVTFADAALSDPGPYPVPLTAPRQDGPDPSGKERVLVVDRDAWRLYEMADARAEGGIWKASVGAIFSLDDPQLRAPGLAAPTSSGMPIFPGLVRRDEVLKRLTIAHALRFTCPKVAKTHVAPAIASGGKETRADVPPMGARVRLKADVDISKFPKSMQVVLIALKRYGMVLSDVGDPWAISGELAAGWSDVEIDSLKQLRGKDFEVLHLGSTSP